MIFCPTGFFYDHKHICIPKIHHFILSKKNHPKNHIAHSSSHQPTFTPSTTSFCRCSGTSTRIGVGECFDKEQATAKDVSKWRRKAKDKDKSGDTRMERDDHQILASINSRMTS